MGGGDGVEGVQVSTQKGGRGVIGLLVTAGRKNSLNSGNMFVYVMLLLCVCVHVCVCVCVYVCVCVCMCMCLCLPEGLVYSVRLLILCH